MLVDLQNDFCHPDGVFARAGFRVADLDPLVAATNALIAAARAADQPVVWITTVWDDHADIGLLGTRSPFLDDEGLRRGTWGAELLHNLAAQPDDTVIEKTRLSGFYETTLHATLQGNRTHALVVGGVRTDFCVESTVRDAFFRDYETFVVEDAVAGYVPALHEHSLRLMNTVFAQVLDTHSAAALLAAARPAA